MRVIRCVAVAAAIGLAVHALAWGTAGPLAAARTGTATFDELVALAAAVVAVVLLGWVGAALAVTALAALPGVPGGASARLADRIAPGVAGRLARLALGLTLTAGPVSACTPALADGTGQQPEVTIAESISDSRLQGVGRIGEVIAPSDSRRPAEPPGDTQPADPDPAGQPATGQPAATEATPTPTAGLALEPTRERPSAAGEVVVKRGDTLWAIAADHLGPDATAPAIAAEWPRWYAANRAVIGDDPDLILPGTILHPPSHR